MSVIALLTNKWTYIAAAFALVVALLGIQKLELSHLQAQKAKLETQVLTLKGQVATRDKQLSLQKFNITLMEMAAQEQRKDAELEALIDAEINSAPPSDDAPMAPVLGKTMDRLRDYLAPTPKVQR